MRVRVLLATAAVLAAAGCGTTAAPAAPPPAAVPSTAVPSTAVPSTAPPSAAAPSAPGPAGGAAAVTVPASLTFTGRTLDGKPFDAATLAGKPTILWFWAPWCATCASQAMSIADVREEYGDRLNILGIAGMGGNKEMHEFVSDLEVGSVPHLDDEPGELWKKFGITEQSTYVIIDRTGRTVVSGYLDDLQLTSKVKALVA
ncbi:TlpA family protein disulfide reductase [Couchioplanes caeruleus]|uniref:Redoxin n=2 Tax=Couchioplanes caeruleus TaxID=56438 RepID=A0A1K0GBA5_9ACTN|nr:redoxin domain-containing protein [Couchioplanes caeruleus]OJF09446.1 redoxin [Couchioplanes caeruleus subsp. caeruleus]ROP34176.1 thiol-disulfide isomerase/thioredoxin [Couchioplanes caeruleus]